MNTADIRTKLHKEIDQGDEKLLKMIYALVKEYNGADDIDDKRKQLVEEEREKYLSGKGRSYSWDEVKQMALNKKRPDDL